MYNDIYGLILTGGISKRMNKAKGSLVYYNKKQWKYYYNLLSKYCKKTYLSCSTSYFIKTKKNIIIEDIFKRSFGPLTGILSAIKLHNNISWFIISCDIPFFDQTAIEFLIKNRNNKKDVTSYFNNNKYEALCSIYEPSSYNTILNKWLNGSICPQSILKILTVNKVHPVKKIWLKNINLIQDYTKISNKKISIFIKYFAVMKEQRGISSETIQINTSVTIQKIYKYLNHLYHFSFDEKILRISVNNKFVNWNYIIKNNDHIIFIPPVAGG